MALSGVRRSCGMMARKSDFVRLRATALLSRMKGTNEFRVALSRRLRSVEITGDRPAHDLWREDPFIERGVIAH